MRSGIAGVVAAMLIEGLGNAFHTSPVVVDTAYPPGPNPPDPERSADDLERLAKAEAKRQRRMARRIRDMGTR